MNEETMVHQARIDALSRRAFLAGAAATAMVGLACPRPGRAAEVTANVGHFGSANPQTYGKATKSWEKVLGPKAAVNYVTVNSGGQVIQLMTAGNLDICNAGSSPIAVGFTNGAPVTMVYVQKYITDSEGLIVRTDRGITSPKDLRGKKIGTPFNSSAHFALLLVMKKAGLSPGDAQILNTPPDQLIAAWRRGAIDAAYIWQPVIAQALDDKGALLVKTGDLLPDGVVVFDGIIVRNDFKKSHPDLVLAYLKEFDRISQLFVRNRDEVVQLMSEFLQLPKDKALPTVAGFHPLTPKEMAEKKWMGVGNLEESGVNKALVLQAEFLKEQGAIQRLPRTFAPFLDASFLERMV